MTSRWIVLCSVCILGTAGQIMSEALYIEGFARALSASNQGDYATGRGINGPSSWEYARDGEQRVVTPGTSISIV